MKIAVKRVYDPWSDQDGLRILVDRLWPRGLSRQTARIDLWLKDIAPSNSLRKEFHANPALWPEFKSRYEDELRHAPEALQDIARHMRGQKTVTLLYAAKNTEQNNAVALREILKKELKG